MKHKPKKLCTKTNDAYTQKNNFKGMIGWREGGDREQRGGGWKFQGKESQRKDSNLQTCG